MPTMSPQQLLDQLPTMYPQQLPNMLRVADVAAYLNVCKKSAYQLVKQPGFPLRILNNKAWRIPRDAFFEWLANEPATKKLTEAHEAVAQERRRATKED